MNKQQSIIIEEIFSILDRLEELTYLELVSFNMEEDFDIIKRKIYKLIDLN